MAPLELALSRPLHPFSVECPEQGFPYENEDSFPQSVEKAQSASSTAIWGITGK
jgi:hypothetical protein